MVDNRGRCVAHLKRRSRREQAATVAGQAPASPEAPPSSSRQPLCPPLSSISGILREKPAQQQLAFSDAATELPLLPPVLGLSIASGTSASQLSGSQARLRVVCRHTRDFPHLVLRANY